MATQTQPSPTTPAEIVSAFFDAFGRGDLTAVDRYFAPDVEYIVIGKRSYLGEALDAIPWLGEYSGRDGAKAFLSHLLSNIGVIGFTPQDVVACGDDVAVFSQFTYRANTTGAEFKSDYAIRIRMRDGLIQYYHFYENTYAVGQAFRQSGAWVSSADGQARQIPA